MRSITNMRFSGVFNLATDRCDTIFQQTVFIWYQDKPVQFKGTVWQIRTLRPFSAA